MTHPVHKTTVFLFAVQCFIGLVAGQEDSVRSAFDRLDPKSVPASERFDGQPKELVAVLGSHRAKASGRIALHPSGTVIACAEFRGGVGAVRLFDAETLQQIGLLRGPGPFVSDVAFSDDGTMLAAASTDNTAHLWSVAEGSVGANQNGLVALGLSFRPRATLKGHTCAVHCVRFSHDGKLLASGDVSGRVLLWDVTGAEPGQVAELPTSVKRTEGKPLALAFSPLDHRLAVGHWLNILLWDLTTPAPTLLTTLEPITGKLTRDLDDFPSVVESLAFSPDGKTLAAGHYNSGGVRLWDMTGSFERESAWLDGHTTRTVAFAPDGRTLFSGGTRLGHAWNLSDRSLRARFPGRWGIAVSNDGQTLFFTHTDSMLQRREISGPIPSDVQPIKPHDEDVRSIAISTGQLVSTSFDETIRIWDIAERPRARASFSAQSDRNTRIALTPDGKQLVIGNHHGLQLWDVTAQAPRFIRRFSNPLNDEVWLIAMSPDGRHLATCTRFQPRLQFWDLTDKTSVEPISSLDEFAHTISYSSDGRFVLMGHSHRQEVTGWNVMDFRVPKQSLRIAGADKSVISSQGNSIVTSGDDGIVRIWTLVEGTPRETSMIDRGKGEVLSLDLSANQQRLLIGYQSGYLLLADNAGRTLCDWQLEHSVSARFAPDSRHLIVMNGNGTAYILRLPKQLIRDKRAGT